MVAITGHHALQTGHEGGLPRRFFGQEGQSAVTFDIGFGKEVDTIFVAKLVPARRVGIVGGAHRVEVELLHQRQIRPHRGLVDVMAVHRVMFVAIDPFDQDRFAVNT